MKKNKKINKKIILIAGVVVLLIRCGIFVYSRSSQDVPVDNWQDGVNYQPPTEDEKAAGDEKKKEIVEEQDRQTTQTQQNPTTKNNVNVAITDASQYENIIEVRSFVPSYSQDGTCTLKFTQGSRTFTRTTPGYKDVSSTVCPAVEVPVSEFPNSGEWQVVVSFESTNAKGQSDARIFSVEK